MQLGAGRSGLARTPWYRETSAELLRVRLLWDEKEEKEERRTSKRDVRKKGEESAAEEMRMR